jgi:hypothetical protein
VCGTADGKAEPFRHGIVTESVASIVFDEDIDTATLPKPEIPDGDYLLLSEEDLEELINQKEEIHNE